MGDLALVERLEDLKNRLRGRYAKGPIMADGEPEFGWAVFDRMPDGTPFPGLYAEAAGHAADAVAALRSKDKEIAQLGSALKDEVEVRLQAEDRALAAESQLQAANTREQAFRGPRPWWRLPLCWLQMCSHVAKFDDTGAWGECATCGHRAGFVNREALRSYADAEATRECRYCEGRGSVVVCDISNEYAAPCPACKGWNAYAAKVAKKNYGALPRESERRTFEAAFAMLANLPPASPGSRQDGSRTMKDPRP